MLQHETVVQRLSNNAEKLCSYSGQKNWPVTVECPDKFARLEKLVSSCPATRFDSVLLRKMSTRNAHRFEWKRLTLGNHNLCPIWTTTFFLFNAELYISRKIPSVSVFVHNLDISRDISQYNFVFYEKLTHY